MNKPSLEFEAMVKANQWHTNLDETIQVIKELSSEAATWSWARNMRCKYVSLNIDMRDGAFTLRNRDGERISLDQLKWQYKIGDEEKK